MLTSEQEMSLDTVSVGGTLLCLNPANLPCLMHTFDKNKGVFFLLKRLIKTSEESSWHFGVLAESEQEEHTGAD